MDQVIRLASSCSDGSTREACMSLPYKALKDVPANLTAGKVWPASVVLSHFLLHHSRDLADKTMFEFGSGIAIPSLSALKSSSVRKAILQELDIPALLNMQKEIFSANSIDVSSGHQFAQLPLRWGEIPKDIKERFPQIDLFVAADCLYEKNDFSDLVATLAFLLHEYPGSTFVMCYQDRNLLYSIDELFEAWELKSELIPFSSFKFSPKFFLNNNHEQIIDDFPVDNTEDILVMLEVCPKINNFKYAPNR